MNCVKKPPKRILFLGKTSPLIPLLLNYSSLLFLLDFFSYLVLRFLLLISISMICYLFQCIKSISTELGRYMYFVDVTEVYDHPPII